MKGERKHSYELEGIICSLLQLTKLPSCLALPCHHAGDKGELVHRPFAHGHFILSILFEFILSLNILFYVFAYTWYLECKTVWVIEMLTVKKRSRKIHI